MSGCPEMTSQYWEKAYEALSLSDEVMAKLIERYRLVPFKGFSSVAESIFRSIVGQQITNVAAATLWDRLCGAKHGRWDSFLAITPTSELRKLGLNPRKIHALKEVAFRFVSGEWFERSFQNMADAEVIRVLTSVKGLGPWSAMSVLIFGLKRGDVFPIDDFGIRQALVNLYFPEETVVSVNRKANRSRVESIVGAWAPYRTAATWFLWRSLENDPR